MDSNPRPTKRARLSTSSPTPTESSEPLAPLPPAVLLISIPSLLVHPPNHRLHVHSLCLSLLSLRKCLSLVLNPDIECRAWTAFAEIGMKVIGGGFHLSTEHPWAKGVDIEVEKAINKGLLIAQKHPSLRLYRFHLTLLQANFANTVHCNPKFARSLLKRLLGSFLPSDPVHAIYSAHLTFISLLLSSDHPRSAQDTHAALDAVQVIQGIAAKNSHPNIILLTHVLRLRILVSSGMWDQVAPALLTAETALGISYSPSTATGSSTPTPKAQRNKSSSSLQSRCESTSVPAPTPEKPSSPSTFISFVDPFEAAMAVHVLIIAATWYTHVGSAAEANPRLSHLHSLLDEGAGGDSDGIVQIKLGENSPPLALQTTHPRILYLLGFLISSTAKRDAVGRKPKRKVFAMEGLAMWEKEVSKELNLPVWSGVGDAKAVEEVVANIKADLFCELIGVSIMRSEFDAAEQNLALLISHTRTYNIFPAYASRITLHHAHLAHALSQSDRALQCYRVAAGLAEESGEGNGFVGVASRAGEVCLRLGLKMDEMETSEMGEGVIRECKGMGGTLEAIGQVIQACLSTEILKAKQHLKQALSIVSKAQDNHMRALILALISSHYFHTASDHAEEMLRTCEQLAAGLGAAGSKDDVGQIGNAQMRLWVGERFLELYKRGGKESRAQKQAVANGLLTETVARLPRAGRSYHKTSRPWGC